MQPSYVSAYVGGTPQVNGLEGVQPLFGCNALEGANNDQDDDEGCQDSG